MLENRHLRRNSIEDVSVSAKGLLARFLRHFQPDRLCTAFREKRTQGDQNAFSGLPGYCTELCGRQLLLTIPPEIHAAFGRMRLIIFGLLTIVDSAI